MSLEYAVPPGGMHAATDHLRSGPDPRESRSLAEAARARKAMAERDGYAPTGITAHPSALRPTPTTLADLAPLARAAQAALHGQHPSPTPTRAPARERGDTVATVADLRAWRESVRARTGL
jgi:hypothetical protein